jgi:S-adenosylmethionine:tRNA ribosyltransferase-isomerase
MIMKNNKQPVPPDFLLSSYAYALPEQLIAQYPSEQRGASRLYVLKRACTDSQGDEITEFQCLLDYLPRNSLLIANNSRVISARLPGVRPEGGKFEFLLLTPPPLLEATASYLSDNWRSATATSLLRPAKKFSVGVRYQLAEGLAFTISAKTSFGKTEVILEWQGSLLYKIDNLGQLPLPPYIKRKPDKQDLERYQTIFNNSAKAGSVAAPTAGLHFTEQIREKLTKAGHEFAELTLYVGYGTFSPVRAMDIRDHVMHPEYVELSEQTVNSIRKAKREKRPVIAIGTTTTRVLEGMADKCADESINADAPYLKPYNGWLNCFIYPGKPIRVIDGLLTNFHLPASTLLMLVSTFCGRSRMLSAYERAIEARMRFFSYGDAMLIL